MLLAHGQKHHLESSKDLRGSGRIIRPISSRNPSVTVMAGRNPQTSATNDQDNGQVVQGPRKNQLGTEPELQ